MNENKTPENNAKLRYVSLREYFQPEKFHKFHRTLGHVAVEISEILAMMRKNAASYINDERVSKEEIAQVFFIRGIEYATAELLAYLENELTHTTTSNPLETLTIATPSENRFVNAGVVALSSILTYYQASRYLNGVMFKQIKLDPTAEEFEAYVHTKCRAVQQILAVLNERFPEMAAEPTPPTVN